MSKAIIYGNGESRKSWDVTKDYEGFTTWGCNAAYRDCKLDNLVAIDYGIQQEIYESGYASKNSCWFADWSTLEQFHPEFLMMNYPRELVFQTDNPNNSDICVVQGKEAIENEGAVDKKSLERRVLFKRDNPIESKLAKTLRFYARKDGVSNLRVERKSYKITYVIHLCLNILYL